MSSHMTDCNKFLYFFKDCFMRNTCFTLLAFDERDPLESLLEFWHLT